MFYWLLWLWVLINFVNTKHVTDDEDAVTSHDAMTSSKTAQEDIHRHHSADGHVRGTNEDVAPSNDGVSSGSKLTSDEKESVTVIYEGVEDLTGTSDKLGDILQKALVSNDRSKVELKPYSSSDSRRKHIYNDDDHSRGVSDRYRSGTNMSVSPKLTSPPPVKISQYDKTEKSYKNISPEDIDFELFEDIDEDDDDLYDDEDDDDVSFLDQMQADYASNGMMSKGGKGGGSRMKKKNKKRLHSGGKLDFTNYSNEYRIKQKLTMYYDKTTRPVRNDSTTTDLYIGMSLYHILDTNEKFQTLSALIAIRLRWMDEYLTWDPAVYGDLTSIWIPALRIWTPDIFINNFADDSFQDFMDTFAIVQHTGEVLWMFPAVVKTYCTLDVRHFPFDHQKCDIMFISWTFHGFKLNVTYNETENNAIYYKPKNQEWYVDQVTVERHEAIYACCKEPYPDVTFTIHMTRRSLFYIINLIFPCLLIYAVSFLGFFLPVESGEKVNLEITILLALVVFLLIVGETLPPTPDAIPALGLLFGLTMIMVSIALVMAVIVTNIFLRKENSKRVPRWLRQIFLRTMKRRNSLTNKITMAENHVNENNKHGPHLDIELDNLSVLSEIETLTCKNRSGSRRKSTMSRAPTVQVNGDIHEDPSDNYARYADEWQALARTVDKIFFWLFLLASVAALTAVFAQIPRYRAT